MKKDILSKTKKTVMHMMIGPALARIERRIGPKFFHVLTDDIIDSYAQRQDCGLWDDAEGCKKELTEESRRGIRAYVAYRGKPVKEKDLAEVVRKNSNEIDLYSAHSLRRLLKLGADEFKNGEAGIYDIDMEYAMILSYMETFKK